MLARKLTLVLIAVVLLTATLLGGIARHRIIQDAERTKGIRLNTLARATRVAGENMLRTGSLEDFRDMIDNLVELQDILGVLVVNEDRAPMIKSTREYLASQKLWEKLFKEEPPSYVREDREGWRARIHPLMGGDGERVGFLAVVQNWKDLDDNRRGVLVSVAQAGGILVALVTISLLAAVRVLVASPLGHLSGAVDAIAEGKMGEETRVRMKQADEIGRLGRAFNQMQDELERARFELLQEHESNLALERSLNRSERLAATGRLAAGVAHEIGTALNIVQGRAQLLLEAGADGAGDSDGLDVIVSQCDRISQTIRRLLDFSRAYEPELSVCSLNTIVREVRDLLAPQMRDCQLRLDLIEPLPAVEVDAARIREALVNLVMNALQALDGGGTIEVVTRASSDVRGSGSAGEIKLTIRDNGPGISLEDQRRIFHPFFTTKPVGEGTGLGLAITYNIVAEHNGTIDVESTPGAGTSFHIYLPIVASAEGGDADA